MSEQVRWKHGWLNDDDSTSGTHKIWVSIGNEQLIVVSPRPEQSTHNTPHALHARPLQEADDAVLFESAVGETPEPPLPEAAHC